MPKFSLKVLFLAMGWAAVACILPLIVVPISAGILAGWNARHEECDWIATIGYGLLFWFIALVIVNGILPGVVQGIRY